MKEVDRHEFHAAQFISQEALHLRITPEKLDGIDQHLGTEGIGTFLIPNVLHPYQLELIQQEVFDPFSVPWRDNHKPFDNERGTVIQNHDVFALRLLRGDQTWTRRVPRMRALAANIEEFTQSLSPIFTSLSGWKADEMSLHRYDNVDVGLGFHKDNTVFFGLVAVLCLEGIGDLCIGDLDTQEAAQTFTVHPGDLMLTRVNGLYEHPQLDDQGKTMNICPDHGVYNQQTPYRTSFIVRANSRPDSIVKGFTYDNWSPDE